MNQEYTEDKDIILKKLSSGHRLLEAVLVISGIFAFYLMIALVSFNPSDPSWSQIARHGPIHNLGGMVGSWFAYTMFFTFGVVAYVLPPIMLFLCCSAFAQRNRRGYADLFDLSLRLIGSLALLLTSCGLIALNVDNFYYFTSGGVIGNLLSRTILPWFNSIGATLALLCVWASGLTLCTGWSWLTIAEKIGAVVLRYLTFISNYSQHNNKTGTDYQQSKQPSDSRLSMYSNANNGTHRTLAMEDDEPQLGNWQQNLDVLCTNCDFTTAQQNSNAPIIVAPTQSSSPLNCMSTFPTGDNDYNPQAKQGIVSELSHQKLMFTSSNKRRVWDKWQRLLKNRTKQRKQCYQKQYYSCTARTEFDSNLYNDISPLTTAFDNNRCREDEDSFTALDTQFILSDYYKHKRGQSATHLSNKNNYYDSALPQNKHFNQSVSQTMAMNRNRLIHPFLICQEQLRQKPSTPLPTIDLLTLPSRGEESVDMLSLKQTACLVEARLADYRIKAEVVGISPGPVITRFELNLAPGVKASRISNLSRDLARSLSLITVRVVEVIPGKPYVGLELPNKRRQTVYLREVLDCEQFRKTASPLALVLGKDIGGQPVIADLGEMPHLLVAGTTGSGKSVGINAMILSILYKATPKEVRFIMIDPKMLELSVYEGIPHLLTEVVTNMNDAVKALSWCVDKMEQRYKLMSILGVRNLTGYNERIEQADAMGRSVPDPFWEPINGMTETPPVLEKLPYIIVIVDEFADLIMAVGKKVEELITRLAQKARAAGIHLVLATQRPSVNVITGLIKANIPTRIAFAVPSKIDSRTILDQTGAESLLGMGDMLYLAPNSSLPVRVHGAFVRDEDVHAVVNDWKTRGRPQYISSITSAGDDSEDNSSSLDNDKELDSLFDQAVAFVICKRRASISGMQRQFCIGYNRAARIIKQMELQGIVSPPKHNGNREVLSPPS